MNARVRQNGYGSHIIEYKKTLFGMELPWWSTLKGLEGGGYGDVYTYTYKYDTVEEATQKIVDMIAEEERVASNKKKTAVVAEVTTEQVKEKFPEFFI